MITITFIAEINHLCNKRGIINLVLKIKTMINTEKVMVSDWMTSELVTVNVDDKISKIQQLFDSNKFHHLLVMDNGALSGIISLHDLLNAYARGVTLEITTAKDFMSSNPLTVEYDDMVGLVADIFLANKYHALPVMEGNEVVGIITSHDLIKYCFEM